jgi:DNA polymerase-3 subunit alpha
VNRKVLESLIKCGALDSFEGHRSQLMAVIDNALEIGMKAHKEEASGQVSFFNMGTDMGGFNKQAENLPDIKEWTQTQILAFEKEILGFYISGHPLAHYRSEIKEFTNEDSKSLAKAYDGENIRIAGLIEGVKLTNTKKTNERMAILTLEDMEGSYEAVVFPSTYVTLSNYLNEGEVVFIFGKVNKREDRSTIIVNDIKYIHDVYGSIKSINVNLAGLEKDRLNVLKTKLLSFPGKVPVYLSLQTQSNKGVQIQVGKDLYVTPNEMLMNEIKEIVGQDAFSVTL